MIHHLFKTCSCVGTSRTIVCVAKLLKISSARATALVALVEIQVLVEAKELLRVVATQAL